MTVSSVSARELISSIFAQLHESPASEQGTTQSQPQTSQQAQKPLSLSQLSPAHKNLVSTLHVLFPNQLLAALDLLDRQLVTRLQLYTYESYFGTEPHHPDPHDSTAAAAAAAANTNTNTTRVGHSPSPTLRGSTHTATRPNVPACYLVQSASAAAHYFQQRYHHHHHRRTTSHGDDDSMDASSGPPPVQHSYRIVHLDAWHCTCPAFALQLFVHASDTSPHNKSNNNSNNNNNNNNISNNNNNNSNKADHRNSLFGGSARDTVVPCCKHMLASLLAEHWPLVRARVPDREVSREQLAGLMSDV